MVYNYDKKFVNKVPATAIAHAKITAAVNVLTSNPVKNLSTILMTIAVTIKRIKNESNPNVIIFIGNLKINPIVAFKMPITRATAIAVP